MTATRECTEFRGSRSGEDRYFTTSSCWPNLVGGLDGVEGVRRTVAIEYRHPLTSTFIFLQW